MFLDEWVVRWMDGIKSFFKDYLQQSKSESDIKKREERERYRNWEKTNLTPFPILSPCFPSN